MEQLLLPLHFSVVSILFTMTALSKTVAPFNLFERLGYIVSNLHSVPWNHHAEQIRGETEVTLDVIGRETKSSFKVAFWESEMKHT